MKIIMICGSPRKDQSSSQFLLEGLEKKLSQNNEIIINQMKDYEDSNKITYDLINADGIILAFPLYVDGIPASFLDTLQNIETAIKENNMHINSKVYVIANNGFYDGKQNNIAIQMIWKWCDKCGLQRGTAIGVGAGGMVKMVPIGQGPSLNLGRALDKLAKDVIDRKSSETMFVEPNFPRFLYKFAAHGNWRASAKKNGLKVGDLRRRLQ